MPYSDRKLQEWDKNKHGETIACLIDSVKKGPFNGHTNLPVNKRRYINQSRVEHNQCDSLRAL